MTTFLVIISVLLWIGSIIMLRGRQVASPAISFMALFCLSFAKREGYPLLPLNGTILTGWLCMTLVVTFIVLLQPGALRAQTRGMGYIIGGAVVGMVVGLLGYTFSADISLLYGIMILSTISGIFLGFLLYTNTPEGRAVRLGSGNFYKYLLAKGFPTAITLIQAGVALVLYIAVENS